MPQMMPLSWMFIYLLISIILFLIMNNIYFLIMKNNLNNNNLIYINNFWKW